MGLLIAPLYPRPHPMPYMPFQFARCFLVSTIMTLTLLMSGCSGKDAQTLTTQVAAKVGSEEISIHQINQVLSRSTMAISAPQSVQALRADVLEKLIDQQLVVEQAIEARLHRSPEVLAQIDAARREVLARAYVQQLTNTIPKPAIEESRKYFRDHPQLFSERRVFSLQEIQLTPDSGVAEQVREQLAGGKSMGDVAAWLKAHDIPFGSGAVTRAAEQIPLDLLARLQAFKDGQSAIVETPRGVTVLRITSSQAAPVTEEAALPRIEQFLMNQRGAEALGQTMKRLRAKATVIYSGDFAKAAPPTAAASDQATPAPKEKAAAADPSNAGSAVEKGTAALK